MKHKKGTWTDTVGQRPHRVTVRERTPGGVIYVGLWDRKLRGGKGDTGWTSLGHRDKERAKAYAAEIYACLLKGEEDTAAGRITLSRLFALYREHRSPRKGSQAQLADGRRIALFTRFLGADKYASKITLAEWNRFIDDRRAGLICPHGARGSHKFAGDDEKECAGPQGKTVRDRTVEADLRWLLAVLNWGCRWQDHDARYLLRENPARGFEVPKEKNPRREVATRDRYHALRAVSDQVMMELRVGRRRRTVRSYLSEMLDLAVQTGRRLSAIRCLQYGDLHLDRTATAPHGAITWRADNDKEGIEWEAVQISGGAREAIDRLLRERGIGGTWLFPAPGNQDEPVSRNLPDKWLREAEGLAGLEPQKGTLWHAYRRMAATEYKGQSEKDVMRLLGWTDPRSLKASYEHADTASTLLALEQRRELWKDAK